MSNINRKSELKDRISACLTAYFIFNFISVIRPYPQVDQTIDQ